MEPKIQAINYHLSTATEDFILKKLGKIEHISSKTRKA